ncbi:B3 domain-containing protein Os12g0592300-like isoform X2 [Asparagus officinalis]|nr:B3 domain-containing protein Os12g0592300-like isoform X2 [Asparagus officinalis]
MKNNCEVCKQWHEHVYWEHKSSKMLRFCVTMVGDFSRQMIIPEKFMSRFRETLSEVISLKGPSGKIWQVGRVKRAGRHFLQCGWKAFAEAHSLEDNDILIFKYEGDSCFSVLIFDSNNCERESTYFAENDHSVEQVDKEDSSQKTLEPSAEADDDDFDCSFTSSPNCQRGDPSCSRRETKKRKDIPSPKQEQFGASLHGNCSENRNPARRAATREERRAAVEQANTFETNSPSFLTVMKSYNVGSQFQLLMPPDFAMEFLPRENQEIILRIPGMKKEWKVNYCVTETSSRIIGRWRNFVRDNSLDEGDACVFELLKDRKRIAMKVHIFRAANRGASSLSA